MKKILLSIASLCMFVIYVNAQNTSPYWSLAGNNDATAASKFGTTNSVPLKFYTNNSPRIVIQPTGNVGIGTSNPSYKLHVTIGSGTAVYGNGTTGVRGNGTSYGVYGNSTDSSGIGVSGDGNLYGVYGNSNGNNDDGLGIGVYGNGHYGYGVYGQGFDFSQIGVGVRGDGGNYGIIGTSDEIGVYGSGIMGDGVYGSSVHNDGGVFTSFGDGYGVRARSINGSGIYATTDNSSNYAGYFAGNVYATGTYTGSDRKLKQNIDDVTNAMDIILKLQPKIYDFRHDGNFKLMNLPAGRHYGLIAQDVETILPGIVKDTKFDTKIAKPEPKLPAGLGKANQGVSAAARPVSDTKPSEIIDFKALNYTEMIPLLIKGMQEQQGQIQEQQGQMQEQDAINKKQQAQIEELKNAIAALTGKQNVSGILTKEEAVLNQNSPNPFNGNTTIQFSVPAKAKQAQLLVYAENGSLLKTFSLGRGQSQVTIARGTLASGNYVYTLLVDGQKVDSKNMILIK